MRFNKDKCKVSYPGCSNPCYQYKLEDERIEHSPTEENLVVLEDGELDMRQQCVFPAHKARHIKRSVVSRPSEVILPLCSLSVRP